MNRLAISQKQVFEILGALTDVRDQEGCFNVDIELDDCLTVNARGQMNISVSKDDDYFTGTGAIYCDRDASVTLTASYYDEDSNTIIDYRLDAESEKIITDYLNESDTTDIPHPKHPAHRYLSDT